METTPAIDRYPRAGIERKQTPEPKKPSERKDASDAPIRVLRFRKTERLVHWSLAIPFLVCYTTALILVVVYNPAPRREYREIFSWIHRISGISLAILPPLALFRSKGDLRIHFYNIAQAWLWTINDFKWLVLMGLSSVSRRFSLPDQGKFNAAEKLNFMMLMTTYPFYVATGLAIWISHHAFLEWVVHFGMAVLATPLVLGHIYMATINRSTRKGLPGMISGFVDRQWAKHHYRDWYREFHEDEEAPESTETSKTPAPAAAPSIPFDEADPRTAAPPAPIDKAVPRATTAPTISFDETDPRTAAPSIPIDEADPRTAAGLPDRSATAPRRGQTDS